LVTEWLNFLKGESRNRDSKEYKIAWLSLDEKDNEPPRFISYMIAAMQTIFPDIAMGTDECSSIPPTSPK
jgi:ATP/maltotriose-dependent transcriptional regulator MalT